MTICYEPVGVIHSPYKTIKGMPIQPVGAKGVKGTIEVYEPFREGLASMDGFSHILVIYHLHRISGYDLMVKPYLGDSLHGIFATRSPKRPNPIGISVLRLAGCEGAMLHVENVDILDSTPVLDIKPYVPDFDVWKADRIGWFTDVVAGAETHKADTRFHKADE